MRMAAARAASRRGADTMIFRPPSQGAFRRKRGMQVVLPAPGGACNTAQALFASVLCKRSRTASTGRPIHGKLFKFYNFLKCDSLDMLWLPKRSPSLRALAANPYTQKCQNTERFARISTNLKSGIATFKASAFIPDVRHSVLNLVLEI